MWLLLLIGMHEDRVFMNGFGDGGVDVKVCGF